MEEKKTDIPLHVLEDLEVVRSSGKYNMYAGSHVLNEIYLKDGMGNTVRWLTKLKGDYFVLDYEKYMSALVELGNLRALAAELSE